MKIKSVIFLFLITPTFSWLFQVLLGHDGSYFDLFFILSLFLAIYFPQVPLLYLAAASGLLKDIMAGAIIGINAFSFTIIALLFNIIFVRLQLKKFYSQFTLVFILSILNNLIIVLLGFVFSLRLINLSFMDYIYNGLANGIIFCLIYNMPVIFKPKKSSKWRINV